MNIILTVTKYVILTVLQAQGMCLQELANFHGIPRAVAIIKSILQMRNWGLWVKKFAGRAGTGGLGAPMPPGCKNIHV